MPATKSPAASGSKKKDSKPRILVTFATAKDKTVYCVWVRASVAEKLGLKAAPQPLSTKKTKKGRSIRMRGSVGAGSMRIHVGNGKYVSVPVPASAGIDEMVAFCKKLKSKPDHFYTPDGGKISVGTAKSGAAK